MNDPYDTLGETYALNMQVSMMRKTIDLMKAMQEHDESLLRQALAVLTYRGTSPHKRRQPVIAALRTRLGDPA